MSLLTKENWKTTKGEEKGWTTYILYLNPHSLNSKGVNLCPYSTKECRSCCLVSAGRMKFSNALASRKRKTELFLANPRLFLKELNIELLKLRIKAIEGEKIAVRLNGTSDIEWEKHINMLEYPEIQFYDYTKIPNRFDLPKNYHLTFSFSGHNWRHAKEYLDKGFNVSVVFEKEIPETFKEYPVINGDEDDLRFLNGNSKIIGLKFKKVKNPIKGKFVHDTTRIEN